MTREYFNTVKINWQSAWSIKNFRYKLFAGLSLLAAILICFPFFFQYIEKRNGILLNDIILNYLPVYNVSTLIFFFIWSSAFLMLITAIKLPDALLVFLIAYIFLTVLRFVTIFLIPLQPPPVLINLADPLSNYFYGPKFITKDLFFSGHVSTVFLIYLCQRNKRYKYFSLFSVIMVLLLVLVQHIHYTIDVIFAIPFTYLCYWITLKILKTNLN